MKEKKNVAGDFVSNENTNKQKDFKKAKKKSDKKPSFFKKIGRWFKETFAELKKVSWPTFGKVVKQTGIVLVVVLIFLVVITAFDVGLYSLLGLVKDSLPSLWSQKMAVEQARWYVIHTYSGYEAMVKDSLEKLIEAVEKC